MEQERQAAEREAHLHSLRTALGTAADPKKCQLSTAAAIEESMAEELRRAIPPPREKTPIVVRRKIDRIERENRRIYSENEPNAGTPRRKPGDKRFSRPPPLRQRPSDKAILPVDEDSRGNKLISATMPPPLQMGISRSARADASPRGQRADPSASATPFDRSERSESAGRPQSPPASTRRPQPPSSHPPTAPSSARRKPTGGYPAAAAMLPASVLADYNSVSTEALPMPLPRRRGKTRGPTVRALDTTQAHTLELQEVLARSGHLLQRPTLRKLVARITGDDSFLPEDDDAEEDFDGMMEPAMLPGL